MAELRDDAPLVIEWVGAPRQSALRLIGELDISNVDDLTAIIEPLLAAPPERLDFDLSGLTFLDSSGIAVLLRAAGRIGTVTLLNPSIPVRRIVAATGLAQILRMSP